MKRFWTEAAVRRDGEGWTVALDSRPLRTPKASPLVLPTGALAEAIAAEWSAVACEVDPRAMRLTGLANAAIDRMGSEAATALARYGETDLLCYRAERPADLVARQAALWDPPLAWAARRFDIAFVVTAGLLHTPQPAATVARLASVTAALGPFPLAGLYPIVTVTGSLVLGLAVLEGALAAEEAWVAGELDAAWQAGQWGDDPLAVAPRDARRADLMAAATLLRLIRP